MMPGSPARTTCTSFVVAAVIGAASLLGGCASDDNNDVTYADIIAEGTNGASARVAAIEQFVNGDGNPETVASHDDVAVLLAVNNLYENRILRAAIVEGSIERGDLTRGGLRTALSSIDDPEELDRLVEEFMDELERDGVDVRPEMFFRLPVLYIYEIQVRDATRRLDP